MLGVLKHSFPNRFSCVYKAEAPNLHDEEDKLGIEVVSELLPQDERISYGSTKYSRANTEEQRQRCENIIQEYVRAMIVNLKVNL